MIAYRYALLAEDDANSVQLFLAIQARHHPELKTVPVSNGEEALAFLRRTGAFRARHAESPSVVFLDLEMPKIDGIEVLEAMRREPELRQIPAVMIAGTPNEVKMRRCYELGANSFVVKPVDFRRFSEFVACLSTFWLCLNEPPS
ncbi:MAG: response regulator [Opitutaceae bacterium]